MLHRRSFLGSLAALVAAPFTLTLAAKDGSVITRPARVPSFTQVDDYTPNAPAYMFVRFRDPVSMYTVYRVGTKHDGELYGLEIVESDQELCERDVVVGDASDEWERLLVDAMNADGGSSATPRPKLTTCTVRSVDDFVTIDHFQQVVV